MQSDTSSMSSSDMQKYVGFFNLPIQVHRKSTKRGFDFTLMVIGESGLGKSTLINSLFKDEVYKDRVMPEACEKITSTVKIETSTVEVEERGVKLRLTIVDTPGFGDGLKNGEGSKTILQYIDEQFERYLRDENSLNRRNIIDTRVHCCFYFISSFGHGLKPLDIDILKQLQYKVNIIPLIAKSDSLTRRELVQMKRNVMQEMEENEIRIYNIPDCEPDEDEDFVNLIRQLKSSFPFAVSSSTTMVDKEGEPIKGREYPWGVVEIENGDHCDFLNLRTLLITHLQDLKEATQEHYEIYRAHRLSTVSKSKHGGDFIARGDGLMIEY